jgi:hypothetical protein
MPTLPSVADGETRLLLQLNSRLSELSVRVIARTQDVRGLDRITAAGVADQMNPALHERRPRGGARYAIILCEMSFATV